MKIHLSQVVACILGLSLTALPSSAKKARITLLHGKRRGHRFQLRFVTGSFRQVSHKIQVLKGMQWIDDKPEWSEGGRGRKNWYGTDGGLPYGEFYSFQVTVDGRKWIIPSRLWSDCYEPNLQKGELQARLSSNGKKLTLEMYGGDGAGSYYVIWLLRADGQYSRTFRSTEEGWK